jgi:molybdate transport system substrate-binding protein
MIHHVSRIAMKAICLKIFAQVAAAGLTCVLLTVATVRADEIKVVTSATFKPAYLELVPEYERATHDVLVTEYGPSMGATHNAIPMRLNRGEEIDVIIMAASKLADLITEGQVRPEGRVDLVRSNIAMAVKAGAPKPDISTLDALKKTLLAAKSIACSDSDSGVYLTTELFQNLGIADGINGKVIKIEATPVGEAVASGKAEIGFQQVSELLPVKGIDVVGPLPPGAQRVTFFAVGIPATAKNPEAAKRLIRWLASPAAYAAIRKSGLEPAESKQSNRRVP